MRYITMMFLIMVLVGCSTNVERVVYNENITNPVVHIERSFPSLGLVPGDCTTNRSSQYIPEIMGKDNVVSDLVIGNLVIAGSPYTFVKVTSPYPNYFWGDVYYSDGKCTPYVIYDGTGTSTYLCDGYIWFIDIHRYYIDTERMPPIVIESRPGNINVDDGTVNYFESLLDDPPFNYIVVQDDDSFAYAAIGMVGLQGSMTVNHDGNRWILDGSFLQPDMDNDRMTWGEYHGTFPCGEVDLYEYDLNTKTKRVLYEVPDTVYRSTTDFEFWELEYSHCDGDDVAYTVVYFDKANGGALDNVPYMNGVMLDHPGYRWCQGISVSDGVVSYQGSNYGYSGNVLFCNGDIIDTWNASVIDSWLCTNGKYIMYTKPTRLFNVQVNDIDIKELYSYNNSLCMISYDGLKTNAM